jgi:hypothetical protein
VKLRKPEPAILLSLLLSLLLTFTGTGGAPLVEPIVPGSERLSRFMMPPYRRFDKRRARWSRYRGRQWFWSIKDVKLGNPFEAPLDRFEVAEANTTGRTGEWWQLTWSLIIQVLRTPVGCLGARVECPPRGLGA